jgi:IS30 family transposase
MARKPTLSLSEAMQLRLNREAGASVKEAAALAGVSEWTAFRELRRLRKKLGPEKFKGAQAHAARQRARAQTFVNNVSSQNLTPNNR